MYFYLKLNDIVTINDAKALLLSNECCMERESSYEFTFTYFKFEKKQLE